MHTLRLSRWRGLATRTEPLLFILHVAYAWLPVGYLLTACAVFGWGGAGHRGSACLNCRGHQYDDHGCNYPRGAGPHRT